MNSKLIVFRSNKYCYIQLINESKVLWTLSDALEKGSKTEKAKLLGENVAKKLISQKINKISFDRNGNKYHGRVKAIADAIRSKGITI